MNEINKNNLAVRNTLYARTLGTLEILYNGEPWELPMSVKGKVMQLFLLLIWAGENGLSRVKLQDFLYVSDEIPNDKIQPISVDYELQELLKGRREITRNKSVINKLKKEKKKYNDMFIKAIIVNVVLVAVIAFMIIITLTSKNPNIIDYENKLQNKYSTWQEELESQEESIKEREEELYKK